MTSREDIHFHNVTCHRSGKEEHGTLSLTRDHLTFSFVPGDRTDGSVSSTERERHVPSSGSVPALVEGGSTLSQSSATSQLKQSSEGSSKTRKAKPKVIWIPYPLINRCILRPSHSQSVTSGGNLTEQSGGREHDAEELFPPSYGTGYERPSTDSTRLAPYSSPRRPASPSIGATESAYSESIRPTAIRLRCRDFKVMAFHFHGSANGVSVDETARQAFFALRSRCCVDNIESMLAFHFHPPQEEAAVAHPAYDGRREFARMGITEKAVEGAGAAWRITDINKDYSFSTTYPSVIAVPRAVSDNMLKYGGAFRSRARVPALAYLHFNGGSITRSSQPLVGVQGKRNPQDERLVSAIFTSHTPPLISPEGSPTQLPSLTSPSTTTLGSNVSDAATIEMEVPSLPLSDHDAVLDEKILETEALPLSKKVYGSTRRNLIVDARPKINALANKATGGGIEDVSNYMSTGDTPIEKVFLNIQNIHVMRSSLEKVVDSMANSDYVKLPPDQEMLRKSGWLGHIAGLLEGSALVARAVGLAGSHALIHCSDGWDRTSQVSALAQLMLDPHYRTLNGFITLVQKDFLAFGHKFRDRSGMQGSEKWFEIENERIAPSRTRDNAGSDTSGLNAFGSKALSGARNWFEKNRGTLFRQQNLSQNSLAENASSRPASPPPNPIIHSPAQPTSKEGKEHKTSEKEICPIFHQFLDAVYQLQRQYPTAFEFNERFLLRLLYQAYSGQYGEFLFNCERERAQHTRIPSVWPHFLARRRDFISAEYVAKPEEAILFPKRGSDQQIDVRWWHTLFGREDAEMNVPRALAPADPPSLSTQPSIVSLEDGPSARAGARPVSSGATLKEAKSAPTLSKISDTFTSSFSKLSTQHDDPEAAASTSATSPSTTTTMQARPPIVQQETDLDVLAKYTGASTPAETSETLTQDHPRSMDYTADEGDPLGVSGGGGAFKMAGGGPDFAAFASQNAFRERQDCADLDSHPLL